MAVPDNTPSVPSHPRNFARSSNGHNRKATTPRNFRLRVPWWIEGPHCSDRFQHIKLSHHDRIRSKSGGPGEYLLTQLVFIRALTRRNDTDLLHMWRSRLRFQPLDLLRIRRKDLTGYLESTPAPKNSRSCHCLTTNSDAAPSFGAQGVNTKLAREFCRLSLCHLWCTCPER